jgi:hypothetical protein
MKRDEKNERIEMYHASRRTRKMVIEEGRRNKNSNTTNLCNASLGLPCNCHKCEEPHHVECMCNKCKYYYMQYLAYGDDEEQRREEDADDEEVCAGAGDRDDIW